MLAYPLQKNSQVALVCTGSICDSKDEVQATADFLATKDLKAFYQQETYLPLPAAVRAEIFWNYLQNEEVALIWSLRGGEGSADILPFFAAKSHLIHAMPPKLLMGFSDFTPILVYFQQQFAWPVIHGPVARQFQRKSISAVSQQETFDWLQENKPLKLQNLVALNSAAMDRRKLSGFITGGNLTLVHLSLQDIWQLQPAGKILLLEEVNEEPYKVSRTLKHLLRIDFFSGVKAVILAGFDFPDKSAEFNRTHRLAMQTVFADFARELSVPVVYTDQIGHGRENRPIPYYVQAELQLATLSFGR